MWASVPCTPSATPLVSIPWWQIQRLLVLGRHDPGAYFTPQWEETPATVNESRRESGRRKLISQTVCGPDLATKWDNQTDRRGQIGAIPRRYRPTSRGHVAPNRFTIWLAVLRLPRTVGDSRARPAAVGWRGPIPAQLQSNYQIVIEFTPFYLLDFETNQK